MELCQQPSGIAIFLFEIRTKGYPCIFDSLFLWFYNRTTNYQGGVFMEISTQEMYRIVFKEYPEVLDVKQVSQLLGVSTKTVYKLIKEGSL